MAAADSAWSVGTWESHRDIISGASVIGITLGEEFLPSAIYIYIYVYIYIHIYVYVSVYTIYMYVTFRIRLRRPSPSPSA